MSNDYDSIYLIPKEVSEINSRSDINISSDFFGGVYPFFSSPMKGISGSELVTAIGKIGGFGILHRFMNAEERVVSIHEIAENSIPYGISVGYEDDFSTEMDVCMCAYENGCKLIVLDCANGYLRKLENVGKKLRDRFSNEISLMCGNVVTQEGVEHLRNAGFDWVRVGIGGSNLCATREVTSIGRNNLAALKECCQVEDVKIIADGGINLPGRAVRAFSMGCDAVMIGSAFSLAYEAEDKENRSYGMASKTLHDEMHKEIKSIEGKEFNINPQEKKPFEEIFNQFIWGLKSACSYLNCKSYKEIPYKSRIIPVNEEFWK